MVSSPEGSGDYVGAYDAARFLTDGPESSEPVNIDSGRTGRLNWRNILLSSGIAELTWLSGLAIAVSAVSEGMIPLLVTSIVITPVVTTVEMFGFAKVLPWRS